MSVASRTRSFYAAPGARIINDDDAQVIGEFIDMTCDGVITPEEFVQKAKPKSSPLHRFCEWDDSDAAHSWRLHQARNLINHICVYDESAPDEKIRAFHRVIVENGGSRAAYVSHDIVWQKPDLVAQVVDQAYRELKAFTNKYRVYQELSGVVEVLDEIVASKV